MSGDPKMLRDRGGGHLSPVHDIFEQLLGAGAELGTDDLILFGAKMDDDCLALSRGYFLTKTAFYR